MNLGRFLKQKALAWALPLPFASRHQEYSTIAFLEDDFSRASKRLLDISIKAIQQASAIDLAWISKRMKAGPYLPELWPGEHYKLLAALMAVHKPKCVVEVGTFRGLGSLAIKGSLPPESELITLDIVPWNQINDSALVQSDFEDGNMRQVIGDLSDPVFFRKFSPTLSGCELLFVDGPKNITFEQTLLEHLATIDLPKNALVLFDDTRLWNMLKIWHDISRPKLDLTSFGHWSGTGIVDWNGQLVPKQ
jgi:predicted O-methyltransferase YrrM